MMKDMNVDLRFKKELYGDEIKERYQYLPEEFREALPRFLTEWCFGDCYTRKAMDIQTRGIIDFLYFDSLKCEWSALCSCIR